jgi:hypothetical protein
VAIGSNTIRGSVRIDLSGEEHFLRYNYGGLRELKEHFGVSDKGFAWIDRVFGDPSSWDFPVDFVMLIVVGLKGSGSMPDATIENVESLMELTSAPYYAECIRKAMSASTSGSVENQKKASGPDPLAETTGTTIQS